MIKYLILLILIFSSINSNEIRCNRDINIRSFKSWMRMCYRNKISKEDCECIKKYFNKENYNRNNILLDITRGSYEENKND